MHPEWFATHLVSSRDEREFFSPAIVDALVEEFEKAPHVWINANDIADQLKTSRTVVCAFGDKHVGNTPAITVRQCEGDEEETWFAPGLAYYRGPIGTSRSPTRKRFKETYYEPAVDAATRRELIARLDGVERVTPEECNSYEDMRDGQLLDEIGGVSFSAVLQKFLTKAIFTEDVRRRYPQWFRSIERNGAK